MGFNILNRHFTKKSKEEIRLQKENEKLKKELVVEKENSADLLKGIFNLTLEIEELTNGWEE